LSLTPTDIERIADEAGDLLRSRILGDVDAWSTRTLASVYRSLLGGDIELVPASGRDLEANAGFRVEILRRIALYRSISDWDAEKLRLSTDPHAFFDDWVWMLDPRRIRAHELPVRPFHLFDFQRDFLTWLADLYDKGRPGACLKSRDMGVSVIAAGFGVWGFLFFPSFIAGYGSYKEDYVWKLGSFDAIIEKCRMIIESLPPQLQPLRWVHKEGHIQNLDTGAEIKGEVGDQLGRGGRASIFFADEFAYVRQQEKSHGALAGTTECCVYMSTTAGPETHHAAMIRDRVMSVRVYPWYWDPRKLDNADQVGNPAAASIWKDGDPDDPDDRGMLVGVGAVRFAREFNCDDIGALERTVIPAEWVRAATDIVLHAEGRTVAGLDLAETRDRSVLIIRQGGRIILHRAWENKTMAEVADEALPLVIDYKAEQLAYDRGGKGAEFGGIIARHELRKSLPPIVGVVPTQPPSSRRYDDAPDVPAKHRFDYKITEYWWSLRHRFRRTWERHTGVCHWDDDDCIQIPMDDRLIRQLTTRKWEEVARGKIGLEPKRKMSESPDDADALVHCEVPAPMVVGASSGRGSSGTRRPTKSRDSAW
jgi:phage terminase large subunit